jgi:signal transduction histidine kinase
MFVSEGAFFSLLVLTGIWFLFWALRKRIELENKTAAILSAASSGMNNPINGIRNDIETLLNSSQMESAQKELIEKISSNVQKIADTCDSVSMIQMLGASKRKIELEMIDISQATESVVAGYVAAHSKISSRIESQIESGLTAVTNTPQWSRIVQGILRVVDNAAPSKETIGIELSKIRETGKLNISWKPGLSDKDIDKIRRDMEAESGIIRELGETIGVKIGVFVESGNSVSITAELPLLEG